MKDLTIGLFLLPLVLFAIFGIIYTSLRRRRNERNDIRGSLDTRTQIWLQVRSERMRSARVRARGSRVRHTTRLEQPPHGSVKVRCAFDAMTSDRLRSVVAADASCGPTRLVAIKASPGAVVALHEPGLFVLDTENSPPGWAIAVDGDEATSVSLDHGPGLALQWISPRGDATPERRGPPEVLEATRLVSRGDFRIYFWEDSVYLWFSNTRARNSAVLLADYLSACLPPDSQQP